MENKLSGKQTHNWSGNTWPQLSQLTEPLWTDPSLKCGIHVHKHISIYEKQNKVQAKID